MIWGLPDECRLDDMVCSNRCRVAHAELVFLGNDRGEEPEEIGSEVSASVAQASVGRKRHEAISRWIAPDSRMSFKPSVLWPQDLKAISSFWPFKSGALALLLRSAKKLRMASPVWYLPWNKTTPHRREEKAQDAPGTGFPSGRWPDASEHHFLSPGASYLAKLTEERRRTGALLHLSSPRFAVVRPAEQTVAPRPVCISFIPATSPRHRTYLLCGIGRTWWKMPSRRSSCGLNERRSRRLEMTKPRGRGHRESAGEACCIPFSHFSG